MKEIMFKIIELPTHQVLIMKDFDNDDENSSTIVITFFVNGVKMTQTLGYKNEIIRDEVFDKITESQVQGTVDNALKMFSNE